MVWWSLKCNPVVQPKEKIFIKLFEVCPGGLWFALWTPVCLFGFLKYFVKILFILFTVFLPPP